MEKQTIDKKQNPNFKKIISFRLTEIQYDLISSKIKKSGIKKSELFRQLTQNVLIEQNQLSTSKIN